MLENKDRLPDTVIPVLESESEKIRKKYDPLGIILVGSYANGAPGVHSDIDLYIIVREQNWRERGNYYSGGYEIEYFVNPVEQVRSYFQQESNLHPHTAHMLSTGIILYQSDQVIQSLVEEAKVVLDDQPELQGTELETLRYLIDDARKDLLDEIEHQQELSYQITAARLLHTILKAFLRYHQQFMEKSTRLSDQLHQLDQQFADLVEMTISNQYEYHQFEKLIDYTENLLGGPRPKTWKLRDELQ